jgi:hypothetical protein
MVDAFLSAHGHDPGPTQRPVLAGLFGGALGSVPAAVLLWASGSLGIESSLLHVSQSSTLVIGTLVMALAGAVYGRVFGRGANDACGGWLFGMAYGFLLWAGGATMILPAISGGTAPAGEAAIGIVLALLLWGTMLGGTFPLVHRRLHVRVDRSPASAPLGPNAASSRSTRNFRQTGRESGRGGAGGPRPSGGAVPN